ncbi:MAG: deoxyuridine 5'-triphosphate nucleotidohydrolase [Candidatus Coatesbacteria bacterium]|nr:MAG: deoxyuridine 5'-triphosphate nucleotidohydrolase [Candidatus Coatesbacteria bacterium]
MGDPNDPLVEPYRPEQVQPNGVELTLASVSAFIGPPGRLGFDNADRRLPEYEEIPFDAGGWVRLEPGAYVVTYAETVRIHDDLFAIARPRSSLLRMGAAVYTALWDTGYYGQSRSLLSVMNPAGIELEKGARLIQLVFFKLGSRLEKGYEGKYRGEN